jgi:hypothetical protein
MTHTNQKARSVSTIVLSSLLALAVIAGAVLALVMVNTIIDRDRVVASQKTTISSLEDEVAMLDSSVLSLTSDLADCRGAALAWQSAGKSIAEHTRSWLDTFPYGDDLDLSEATEFADEAHSFNCI